MKKYNTNEYPFFKGAKAIGFENARTLRKESTQAEQILWRHLRGRIFYGMKYRRQHPVNQFIVDFYCDEKKLVIELDGEIHLIPENKERDEGRELMLKEWGLNVIRFTNDEVEENLELVLEKLKEFIDKIKT